MPVCKTHGKFVFNAKKYLLDLIAVLNDMFKGRRYPQQVLKNVYHKQRQKSSIPTKILPTHPIKIRQSARVRKKNPRSRWKRKTFSGRITGRNTRKRKRRSKDCAVRLLSPKKRWQSSPLRKRIPNRIQRTMPSRKTIRKRKRRNCRRLLRRRMRRRDMRCEKERNLLTYRQVCFQPPKSPL